MSLKNPHIHISRHKATHIGNLQSFDTIMYDFSHHISIPKSEQSLFTSLDYDLTYKIDFYLVIGTTNTINREIESSEISTQRAITKNGMTHVL